MAHTHTLTIAEHKTNHKRCPYKLVMYTGNYNTAVYNVP